MYQHPLADPLRVSLDGAGGAGAATDRSITATTASQTLADANADRKGLLVKNDTTIDVWISFTGAAVAAAGAGSYRIAANGGWYETGGVVPTSAVTIIAASGTPAISALEV